MRHAASDGRRVGRAHSKELQGKSSDATDKETHANEDDAQNAAIYDAPASCGHRTQSAPSSETVKVNWTERTRKRGRDRERRRRKGNLTHQQADTKGTLLLAKKVSCKSRV